ncbi:hypothetical protein HK097_009657 [Rhizophlyctis rosea]|uniref:Uncharacterized protein n=1 Tax=Rhizophlyctis rosea TaxID=64517 RepID=A0AAD5X579_9FUNG|nr:hypothetical protein HK097_009657 [Rhizophlyctis rosea]
MQLQSWFAALTVYYVVLVGYLFLLDQIRAEFFGAAAAWLMFLKISGQRQPRGFYWFYALSVIVLALLFPLICLGPLDVSITKSDGPIYEIEVPLPADCGYPDLSILSLTGHQTFSNATAMETRTKHGVLALTGIPEKEGFIVADLMLDTFADSSGQNKYLSLAKRWKSLLSLSGI